MALVVVFIRQNGNRMQQVASGEQEFNSVGGQLFLHSASSQGVFCPTFELNAIERVSIVKSVPRSDVIQGN